MRNPILLLPLLGFLFLAACAGTPRQPDWVNGNSSQYPPARYLTGKGEGELQALARDRARADLAKIFEVRIQEQSSDRSRAESQSQNGETRLKLESSASREIVTRTDQIIAGIRIAETWQDPASKRFHALAVLDRMQAGNALRAEIDRLDDITGLAIRRARQSDNLLHKIGLAHKALQAQLEREIYNRQLKIVDYSGRGRETPYNLARLARDRDALLQRMKIRTRVGADPVGGLDRMLQAAVAAAGFTPANEDKGVWLLEAELELSPSRDAQGWHWLRGSLSLRLVQADSGQAQGSHRWHIKESAQDPDVAKDRVRSRIDKILKTELRPTLIGFGSPETE